MKKASSGICGVVLTVAALICPAAAQAQASSVALFCSWPNEIGFLVDVNYAASQVTVVMSGETTYKPAPSPARITDNDIRWTASVHPNIAPSNFYINRLTGSLTACGGGPNSLNENFCNQPMKCVPRKAVF